VLYQSIDGKFDKQLHLAMDEDSMTSTTRSYVMVGAARFVGLSMGRAFVIRAVAQMGAAANVLALAQVEVDLQGIAVGSTATIKWRGKPVFIRHRTDSEIEMARAQDHDSMRDPQPDAERAERPQWLIVLGVCTHLGCVPLANSGNYNGWFCPCHGSHYDISARIRQGPAPLNLEIPEYSFVDDNTVRIG